MVSVWVGERVGWLAGWLAGCYLRCQAVLLQTRFEPPMAGFLTYSPSYPAAPHPQGRGKLHRAILLHMLGGSLADVHKAALVSTHAALGALGAASAAAPPGGASACMQQRPEVAMVLGSSIVVLLPAAFTAAHAGGGAAAAGAVAAAVRGGLGSLYVGRAQLAAPPAAVITVGRTLHPLDQQPVWLAPAAQHQRG